MTRKQKDGGLIALHRKRKKERLGLADGQQTVGSCGAEHTDGVDIERMLAAGEDSLKFAFDFLDIEKAERQLRDLSSLILSYVLATGSLKMPLWKLQCIQHPEQWDRCPLVQVLHHLLQVRPGHTIEETMLSLPHDKSDNPALITAIIVFLLEEFVFQKDSPFEMRSARKVFQQWIRSEETLENILQESRLDLLTEKSLNFATLCSLHREEFIARLSQVMEPIVGVNPTTVHYHERIAVLGDKLKTRILAHSGTYKAVTAPIRGTFDPHLHKTNTPMPTEQNLKGLPIFLTTMIGVKCNRPGEDWKICVHAQVILWPSVVPREVKPNLVEERATKRRKTERATKTRSTAQTLERDRRPPQTKRQSLSPVPWTDLNPDWLTKWRSSIVYPPTGKNKANVYKEDVKRLNEGEFLNDNLIVFYLRWLQCQLEKRKPGTAKRIFFHNSFFYLKLTSPKEGMSGLNYAGVERWTKDDLLHYDYIIVPINEHMHWYVAIICNAPKLLLGAKVKGQSRFQDATEVPERYEMKASNISQPQIPSQTKRKSLPAPRKHDCEEFRIITMDSLRRGHSTTCTNLRDYLVLEARAKLGIDIPRPGAIGTTAKGIPLQDNYCDCGVFLLIYIEKFLNDPDTFISRILQSQVSRDMEWPKAPETRIRIRELLFSLQKEQSSEMPTPCG